MQDETLRQLVLACLKASLKQVEQMLSARGFPQGARTRFIREDGTKRSETVYEPDVVRAVFYAFREVSNLGETRQLLEYIESSAVLRDAILVDASGEPIPDADTRLRFLVNFWVCPMLEYCIGPELALDYDDKRADEVYASLVTFLGATDIPCVAIAPLSGCEGSLERLSLNEHTCIRHLTSEEHSELSAGPESTLALHELFGFIYCVESVQVVPRGAPLPFGAADEVIRDAVTALRLVKPGAVSSRITTMQPRRPAFGPGGGGSQWAIFSPLAMGPQYVLEPNDAQLVQSVFTSLQETPLTPRLDLALRRFNAVYERARAEDKLLDCWVALEALLLPDEGAELSYRASLRVAYLLHDDFNERQRTFRVARQSYRDRSTIAHGGIVADVQGISRSTEELLRRTLRTALDDPNAIDSAHLDENILRGS